MSKRQESNLLLVAAVLVLLSILFWFAEARSARFVPAVPAAPPIGEPPRFDEQGIECRLVFASGPIAEWCTPQKEVIRCSNGVLIVSQREVQPDGTCAQVSLFYPPGHPDAEASFMEAK